MIRDLVYHLPLMVTPRWVHSRSQPIALDDLLEILVRLPELEETAGKTYDAVGPQTLTYEELLRQFARVVRRPLRIVPVPVLSPRLSSWWLDLVTSVPARVARPLIDGLKHDLVSERPDELRELLPWPQASYEQAVRAALDAEAKAALPVRWTEGAFGFRQQRHDVSYYGKSARYEARCAAPPAAAWAEITAIGGEQGWYYTNALWRLRGLLDRLVGGAGMRRGRRHPSELRAGDPLDFWRVASVEPERRLTLVAEMRLPGSAILELAVEPRDRGSSVVLQAHFHPAGAPGLLYWYALWPVHRRIFERLPRAIAERAGCTRRQPGRRAHPESHSAPSTGWQAALEATQADCAPRGCRPPRPRTGAPGSISRQLRASPTPTSSLRPPARASVMPGAAPLLLPCERIERS